MCAKGLGEKEREEERKGQGCASVLEKAKPDGAEEERTELTYYYPPLLFVPDMQPWRGCKFDQIIIVAVWGQGNNFL